MKKLLSALLCLVLVLAACPNVSAASEIAINNLNFPDKYFRDTVSAAFDKDGNKKLSASEISNAKELNCSDYQSEKKIESFQGIEYLTELTVFDCSQSLVKSLNLKDNKKLEVLSCDNNKLTSLDVSGNPKLAKLYCNQNPIRVLDVTNNPELTHLYLYANDIHELDLSKNTKLQELDISYCKLGELDLTNNTELEFLNLEHNSLAACDIKHLKKLNNLRIDTQYIYVELFEDRTFDISDYCSNFDMSRVFDLEFGTIDENGVAHIPTELLTYRYYADGDTQGKNTFYVHYIVLNDQYVSDTEYYDIAVDCTNNTAKVSYLMPANADYDFVFLVEGAEHIGDGVFKLDEKGKQFSFRCYSNGAYNNGTVAYVFKPFYIQDIDGNGAINAADASYLLRADVKLVDLTEEQLKNADTNLDGKVNTADAANILRYNVSLIKRCFDIKY